MKLTKLEQPARARRNQGFTLLETMVTMVVLSVGLLTLAPMVVLSMRGNQVARKTSDIAYLAQERIEQLKNQPSISPMPFNETTNNIDGVYTRTVNVSDKTVDGAIPEGVYRITVTISWVDNWNGGLGQSHSTSYTTYKVK
ncbi:MAG: prepilin-type N-terminal cleavage/methylation domain-containing protein [candidate division Zixibacteria bacterium]|nr:prepilin-type N-terminal cleavage/methylation domain-containing protein [candidate division Zixibacteria bacterium]